MQLYFDTHWRKLGLAPDFPIDLMIIFLAVFYIVTQIVLRYKNRRRLVAFTRDNGCAEPPQIRSSFLNGVYHKWKRLNQRGDIFNGYMNQMFRNNGTTHAILDSLSGRTKAIYTVEPENVKMMLSTRFADYHRPLTMPNALNPVMGQGVFTSNGDVWAHSRRLVRAQFSGNRVKDISKLDKYIQDAFEAIEDDKIGQNEWSEEQELLLIFNRFTLDSATEFMFGTSADSHKAFMLEKRHDATKREITTWFGRYRAILNDFATAFDVALDYVALRLKLGRLWFLADGIAFRLACYKVRSYTDDYIRRAVSHAEATKQVRKREVDLNDSDDRRFGLISELVESYPDKAALRNQVLQLLVAGRDTTAATLTWAFILLEAHPDILARLGESIIEVFGLEKHPKASVTYENLRSCTYLQHVVFEVVRLYPTGPLNARKATVDTVLPVGGGPDAKTPIAVQKGTIVAYNTYLMHRLKEFWGDNSWDFRPERWEGRKVGWEYIPFHGGPQTCLGRKLYSGALAAFLSIVSLP